MGRVRRALGLRRVGHGGTLDPAVTGVLPIAVGAATRLLPYLPGDKLYRGTLQLGVSTTSDDLDGAILRTASPPADLTAEALEPLLEAFRGPILQRPPQVSAVHVDGERAHVRSRRGETLDLPARPVTIQRLELLGWDPASGRLELLVGCSAGTYIRSLARDIGERLGCGGALASLRRLEALGFGLDQAISLEALDAAETPPLVDPLLALPHLPRHPLVGPTLDDWRCGRRLAVDRPHPAEQPVAVIDPDGRLAGIARADGSGGLQPKLVFEANG